MSGFDLRTRVSPSYRLQGRPTQLRDFLLSGYYSALQDSSRSSSVDGDILNQNHCSNQKRNSGSGRRHNAKDSGSNNVQQRNDESFHLLETGKNKSGDDDDVAGNFRYEASWVGRSVG